jgi:F420-non-reducing hydrogenase large subunit
VVVGGISFDLAAEKRAALEKQVDEMLALAKELAPAARDLLQKLAEKEPRLLELQVPSYDLGLVVDGKPNHVDGMIRLTSPDGKVAAEIAARDYAKYMIEHSFDWSYMKPVAFLLGGQEVTYRVGALARLNVADAMGTPLAQAEFEAFRKAVGRPCHIALMYNWARIVEILWACERAKAVISDPAVSGPARIPVRIGAGRGVGCVEAPRGTLIHEYEVDDRGIVRMANLLIATQQNYASINRSLEQAAGAWVAGKGDAAVLNAVEFALRCYDPCLSCATHAVGRMPIEIEMRRNGEMVRRLRREG